MWAVDLDEGFIYEEETCQVNEDGNGTTIVQTEESKLREHEFERVKIERK